MRPLPALLLLATLLLAGCLEEPPASQGGGDLETVVSLPLPSILPSTRPVPTPEPTPRPMPPTVTPPAPTPPLLPPQDPAPEGQGDVIHRNKRAADGPEGRVVLRVPEGVATLRVEVEANGTYAGNVTLTSPEGAVVARFVLRSGAVNVQAPPAGEWVLRYSPEVDGEVAATVTLYRVAPQEPSSSKVAPGVVYNVRWTYDGLENRTDRFTVLPGHDRLVGTLAWLDREGPGSATWADNVSMVVYGPGAAFQIQCRPPEPCRVDVAEPQAGMWMVYYNGYGVGGLAYANLTLQGEGAKPPSSVEFYRGSHAYWSWGERRGDFGEGFTLPAGFTRLSMYAEWMHPFEAGTSAAIDLVSPSGAVLGTCVPAASSLCEVDLQRAIEPGLHEVRYRGSDRTGHATVLVKGM